MRNLRRLFVKLFLSLKKRDVDSILRWFCVGCIHFYQIYLSPFFGGNCRFTPSCSHYAKDCFNKHNTLQAMIYVTRRLWNCRPFGPSGYDPVPQASVSPKPVVFKKCIGPQQQGNL